jgi:hypothetical protein
MNQLSHPMTQTFSDLPEISDAEQELTENVRAMRALGILLESKLIDRSEYERRAAIFEEK